MRGPSRSTVTAPDFMVTDVHQFRGGGASKSIFSQTLSIPSSVDGMNVRIAAWKEKRGNTDVKLNVSNCSTSARHFQNKSQVTSLKTMKMQIINHI